MTDPPHPPSNAWRDGRELTIFRKAKNGGEGGIRTRGTLKGHTGFRNRLLKPLGHLSETFNIDYFLPHLSIAAQITGCNWNPLQTNITPNKAGQYLIIDEVFVDKIMLDRYSLKHQDCYQRF